MHIKVSTFAHYQDIFHDSVIMFSPSLRLNARQDAAQNRLHRTGHQRRHGYHTLKPAKLETGVEVRVPLFINEGEIIEVDMRDGSYVNRLKA